MRRIERDAQVMVMTGYPDSQMQFQGFEATVIEGSGSHFRVRDREGKVYDCDIHELTLLDDKTPH